MNTENDFVSAWGEYENAPMFTKQEHLKMMTTEMVHDVDSLKELQDMRNVMVEIQQRFEQEMSKKMYQLISKQTEEQKKCKALIDLAKSL